MKLKKFARFCFFFWLLLLLNIVQVGEPENRCAEGEFQCAIGDCIMGYKRCNGIRDCPSGNDEVGCQDIGGTSLIFNRTQNGNVQSKKLP